LVVLSEGETRRDVCGRVPVGAMQQRGFKDSQILAMIREVTG